MVDPFIGEIRIFGGNFAPTGWALCNGQLLPIAQNTALFSVLGTMYGGDGVHNFGLPNLQGRNVLGMGGIYVQGEIGGQENITLTTNQLPAHSHTLNCTAKPGTADTPEKSAIASGSGATVFLPGVVPDQPMADKSVSFSGSSAPINIQSPYLVLNFIIALQGTFPSRG